MILSVVITYEVLRMWMHSIEAGQRLRIKSGDAYTVVELLAEAVVPCGYWICRDEASGQRRVVAQNALLPLPTDVPVSAEIAPIANLSAA